MLAAAHEESPFCIPFRGRRLSDGYVKIKSARTTNFEVTFDMKETANASAKILAGAIALTFVIMSVQRSCSLLSFINTAFLLSLALLIVSGFLFVYEGGFFNGLINSYRRLYRLSKIGRYLAELELDDDGPFMPQKRAFTLPLLLSALVLFMLTLSAAYFI
jgi:hypothetical protein